MILLSIPPIQTLVAEQVTKSVNAKFGTSIHVAKVGLTWSGRVSFQDVLIHDHKQDTLIHTKRLRTRLQNIRPLLNGKLNFRHTNLTKPYFHIKTYKGEDTNTISIFAEKFQGDEKSEEPFVLSFSRLILDEGSFVISNENFETPEIFSMHDIYLKTDKFKLVDDVIDASIQKLAFTSFDGLKVTSIEGQYHFSSTQMRLEKMLLETTHSKVEGNLLWEYPVDGLGNFIEEVIWDLDINASSVGSDDIRIFYDGLGTGIEFGITSKMKGSLNDFELFENSIAFRNTSIQGDFSFKKLIDEDRGFTIHSNDYTLGTNDSDLRVLLPEILGDALPKEVKNLGRISFHGESIISADFIHNQGRLGSDLGIARLDLGLEGFKDFDNAKYHGKIDLKAFDLGLLVNNKNIGKISSVLKVNGRGTKAETIDTELEGKVSSFYLNKYNYSNISLEGDLKYPLFNGEVSIKDPNLDMDFDGLINMSDQINEYDFKAQVNFSDLNQLNLVSRDSVAVFTGKVAMDMDGTNLDDIVGEINFQETFYQTAQKYFYFDDFTISFLTEEETRRITINSPDIVTGQLSGQFKLKDIPQLLKNGIGSIYTNYKPREVTSDQFIAYDFEIHNKIVDLFIPELELGDNTRLKGEVSSDEKKFKLDFQSPEIMAYNNYLGKVNLQVDYDNPMHNTYLTIDTIHTKIYSFNGIEVENTTKNDTLSITTNFRGGTGQKDFFDLSFFHTINPEGYSVFGVKKSGILFNNNLWYFNQDNNNKNKLILKDNFNDFQLDSLELRHKEEYIRMTGVVKDSTFKDLHLNFENVMLSHLIPNVDSLDVVGKLNGYLDFKQQGKVYTPTSNISVESLELNRTKYGDFHLNVQGSEDLTRFDIASTLISNKEEFFKALGYFEFNNGNPNLNVNLDFNSFDISGFSPFGANVVSRIHGFATGRIQLSGDPRAPEALGRLYLKGSGMQIPYLNVAYQLQENTEVRLSKNTWQIQNAEITDTKYNSKGRLNALITHQNFRDIHFDMRVNANEMLVLDTNEEEDALYYGTAFISGEAWIHGPATELTIDVSATTEKNTSFTIPLSDAESIGDDSFIVFLSPEEKKKRLDGEEILTKDIKGLAVNFDLNINNNAEVHVVVDKTNNSTLRARGLGTLLIQLNTLGKFNMEGDFQVVDGDFDFRYGGIIHKLIKVVPGGFISWDGNPEQATINLQAKYETEANPSVLLDNTSINRTIPVEVIIDLSGQLTQPELAFDIEFPRVSSSVKNELQYKLQNREERDKQALFIIASGSFVNDNFQGSNAFTGTLADKVSGLLNELFTDKEGKFKVGLDYTQGSNLPNQETADRFGISLSTHINERILINGKVGVPIGGVYENSIAGDIEVQWLVNKDGSLRLLFFNRQADIQFLGENQIFEQGAGISYSVDFATFKELIRKFFNKNIELESEFDSNLEILPDDNSYPVQFIRKDQAILPKE